jgi:hypothetical protein
MSGSQQHLASALPMQRSVSVPGSADAGIEKSPSQQHSFFSPTGSDQPASASSSSSSGFALPPAHPSVPQAAQSPSAIGHSHHASSFGSFEPQTPTQENTHSVAAALLQGLGAGERRNSKPNLRLQSQAPSKLSSAALSVPSATLFAPASPMTPSFAGGAPPPNTPLQLSQFDSLAGEPVTPLFDQPFTPQIVPMSPMLPQAPPPSPYPSLSLASGSPSPLMSPQASPHPLRQILNLPATMSGVEVNMNGRFNAAASEDNQSPPPLPAEDDIEDDRQSVVDASNTVEVEVKSDDVVGPLEDTSSPEKLLLHRSRLGRLSIIHREDVRGKGLLGSPVAPSHSLFSPASSVASPTAISNLSQAELAAHSKKHGPTVVEVTRLQHVTFNPNDASSNASSLQNIPPEWREALKNQFGIPVTLCQSVKLKYHARIPLVLVKMADALRATKGFEQVGIFRLAPDATACATMKAQINANINNIDAMSQSGKVEPNLYANLIKVWLRDLPVALFQSVPPDAIASVTSLTPKAEVERLITEYLKEPSQSVYRWLLDLACDITAHAPTNKMIAKNVAICISPNLYKPPSLKASTSGGSQQSQAESLKIMAQAKLYSNFFEVCIGIREVERGQPNTAAV